MSTTVKETTTVTLLGGMAEDATFLANALGHGTYREFSSCLRVEREGEAVYMVATDGKRLHMAIYQAKDPEVRGLDRLYAVEPGASDTSGAHWTIVNANGKTAMLTKVTDSVAYPKWRKAIPTVDETKVAYDALWLPKHSRPKDRNKSLEFSTAACLLAHVTKSFYNIRYLEDVATKSRTWTVRVKMQDVIGSVGSSATPIRLDHEHLTAVIMPAVAPKNFDISKLPTYL